MPVPSQEYDSFYPFVWCVWTIDFAIWFGTFLFEFSSEFSIFVFLLFSEQIISSIENETVFKLSDVVCATSKSQEFLDSIIPLITEKLIEPVKPWIALIIDECIQPHLLNIKHNKEALIY